MRWSHGCLNRSSLEVASEIFDEGAAEFLEKEPQWSHALWKVSCGSRYFPEAEKLKVSGMAEKPLPERLERL